MDKPGTMVVSERPAGKPVLREGYYLDNFLTLIAFVVSRYADILNEYEMDFVRRFGKLSISAKRLYVRLITRTRPVFRKDKIRYAEIGNVDDAIRELADDGFMEINPPGYTESYLQCLTREELLGIVVGTDSSGRKNDVSRQKKSGMIEQALREYSTGLDERLFSKYMFLVPLDTGIIKVFFLLFFGNTGQGLSEFIMEDIGVLRYEPYLLTDDDRLFSDRNVVDGILMLDEFTASLQEAILNDDIGSILKSGEELVRMNLPAVLEQKRERRYNLIGRFCERHRMWEAALRFYRLSTQLPARERIARILEKLGRDTQALEVIHQIIRAPVNEEEKEFAELFLEKLKRKTGLEKRKVLRKKYEETVIRLPAVQGQRVEDTILEYYRNSGFTGYFSENSLWTSLFGLACWDIIFMPVPHVFFHPFQRGPVDLFTADFRVRRADQLEERIRQIRDDPSWKDRMLLRYREKYNTANYLVAWKKFSYERVKMATEWIPSGHMADIFDRMATSLRDFSSGFPDLVLFSAEKRYLLLEVKGPGDQLRPNQKRWFDYFSEKGIPVGIARLEYAEDYPVDGSLDTTG